MKRIETGSRSGRIQWDEVNLEENEKIKQEFASIKVEEPKTPYHGPDMPDEFDEDPNPFALEASEGGASPSGMSVSDLGAGSGPSSNGDAGAGPSRARRSHSGGASFTSSEGGGEHVDEHGNKLKRRRFEAARRAHYNMKEALALGRELVSSEHDDDEVPTDGSPQHDQGGPGEDDGLHGQAAAGAAGGAGGGRKQQQSVHRAWDGDEAQSAWRDGK